MKEPMQFEYSMKNFSIDEPFSQMIVTENEVQKGAICDVYRTYIAETIPSMKDPNDLFYMLYSMKNLEKHFFIRECGSPKNCLSKVNEFAQWCKQGTIPDETSPYSLFFVFTGSSDMEMSDVNWITESIIESFCGKYTKNLTFIHLLNIDKTIEQPDYIELSILFSRKND